MSKISLIINAVKYFLILVVLGFFLFPIYWIFRLSLAPQSLVYDPSKFFFIPTLKYYKEILFSRTFIFSMNYTHYFLNSLIVSTLSTAMALIIGALAAYAFARFKFKGSSNFEFYILSALFAPPAAFIVPIFLLLRTFGLLDTQFGLALVYLIFNIPFTTWMLKSIFREIPVEIEEAAMIDGCSRLQVLTKVTLPLARTGIGAAAIFDIILSWNEYTFASVLTSTRATTLPVTLGTFVSSGVKPIYWGYAAASAVLVMLPMIILAFIIQKHLVRGLTLGAVKG
mgnify:CR=1 FL=1